MSFLEHVYTKQLTAIELDIYYYIVNNVEKIPYMRIRDIAEEVHVSSTSVFRFIKQIGFDSFLEFKLYVKAHLREDKTKSITCSTRMENQLAMLSMEVFHPDINHQLDYLSEKIQAADFTFFVGLGSSASLAEYIARKLSNIDYRCLMVYDSYVPHIFREHDNICFVILSVSGETRELVDILHEIELKPQIFTCCITQNKESSISRRCDYTIGYKVNEKRRKVFLDLSNQMPTMLILEALFDRLYNIKM